MKVTVLDDCQDTIRKLDCFSLLQDHKVEMFSNTVKSVGQLAARVTDVEAIVLIRKRTRVMCQLLDRLPKLKIIGQTGRVSRDSGDYIDLDAYTDRSVMMLGGKGSLVAPAELTWALMTAAQRHIPQYMASLKHNAWQQSGLESAAMPPNFGIDRALKGQTLDIFGHDKVGQLVIGYGRVFDMNALVWGREGSQERARADGFAVADSKDALFGQSNVLSVHLRLDDGMRDIVMVASLTHMGPTTPSVNASRAELVEEDDLTTSLNRGRPGMAATDVFETEPILQSHILLRTENCICTPHIGYVEREGYELYFSVAFQNILDVLQDNVGSVINPTALAPTLIRA